MARPKITASHWTPPVRPQLQNVTPYFPYGLPPEYALLLQQFAMDGLRRILQQPRPHLVCLQLLPLLSDTPQPTESRSSAGATDKWSAVLLLRLSNLALNLTQVLLPTLRAARAGHAAGRGQRVQRRFELQISHLEEGYEGLGSS
jgi:hypothetical protein